MKFCLKLHTIHIKDINFQQFMITQLNGHEMSLMFSFFSEDTSVLKVEDN